LWQLVLDVLPCTVDCLVGGLFCSGRASGARVRSGAVSGRWGWLVALPEFSQTPALGSPGGSTGRQHSMHCIVSGTPCFVQLDCTAHTPPHTSVLPADVDLQGRVRRVRPHHRSPQVLLSTHLTHRSSRVVWGAISPRFMALG